MRVVFVGASSLAVHAARTLVERGHEVVVVDEEPEKIEALSDELDCGLVAGDGARPSVLEELAPEHTPFLFCVSDRDEANILAALIGRELGFEHVVPKIEDAQLEPICARLGLDEVIVPDREIGLRLVDAVEGRASPELAAVVRSGLRFLSFEVPDGVSDLEGLELPDSVRVIARTRGDISVLVDGETSFEAGDLLVTIAEDDAIDGLLERFCADADADTDDSDD